MINNEDEEKRIEKYMGYEQALGYATPTFEHPTKNETKRKNEKLCVCRTAMIQVTNFK